MSADKSDDDKLGNKQYSGENKHKTHIFYSMLASYLQPLSNENYLIYNLEMFNHLAFGHKNIYINDYQVTTWKNGQ